MDADRAVESLLDQQMGPSLRIAAFIQGWEACRLTPYRDQAGHWTVGWGHLMQADDDMQAAISQDDADALFQTELADAGDRLFPLLARPVTQCQYDGMLAFAYNVGLGAFAGSTLRRCINGGDVLGAAAQFEVWSLVTIDGVKTRSDGLLRRRRAEKAIFVGCDYSGRP